MAGSLAGDGLRARTWRAMRVAASLAGAVLTLAGCMGNGADIDRFTTTTPPSQFADASPPPPAPTPPANDWVRVALILPLSAQGNAGLAAQSMKNAAEM